MYIARLHLKNFKSFGENHDLRLDSGFTAIVGPNGSGKSNILDALRWGLGEGSGSRLRITRQSDLLFQGTATLTGASSAEVALDLKEGEKSSTIRRKYSHDGGASVLVDGLKIRLQDLQEVKRRWRLDGDRFAFIGQGEVTSAVSQRPMERRSHLEELFGIDLYRKRRDQAFSRMTSAEEELRRLQTLMAELRARRDEIASDVSSAEKAQRLEEELEFARSSFYHHKRYFLEQDLQSLEVKVEDTRRDLEEKQSWRLIWENGFALMKGRSADTEREQIDIKTKLDSVEQELEKVRRSSFELDTSLKVDRSQFERLTSDLERAGEKKGKLEDSKKELSQKVEGNSSSLSSKIEERDGLERYLLERSDEIEEVRRKRSNLISQRGHLRESIEGLRARKEAMASGEKKTAELVESLKSDISSMKEERSDRSEVAKKARESYDSLKKDYSSVNETCRSLAIQLQPLRKKLYKLEAEQEQLKNKSSQGFYPSAVNHIMSASDLGRIAIRPVPVIEAFDCPSEYSIAMEAYLGGRQFWLLVESIADAREGIEELKRHNAGRATYLPLASAKPRKPKSITLTDGIVGWAIDLVEVNEVWRMSLEHLFGDLLIVEDYDTASSLVKEGHRFPIVTLDGEVFSPGGTISGGKTRRSGGALMVRSKLRSVEEELLRDREEQHRLETLLKRSEEKESILGDTLEAKGKVLSQAEIELSNLDKSIESRTRELDLVISEMNSSLDKSKEIDKKMAEEMDLMRSISGELESLSIEEDEEDKERLIELRSQVVLAQERLDSARKDFDRTLSELSSCEADCRKFKADLLSLDGRMKKREKELKELLSQSDILSKNRDCLARDLEKASYGNRKFLRALNRCSERFRLAEDKKSDAESKLSWLLQRKEDFCSKNDDLISSWEEYYPYEESFSPSQSMEDVDRSMKNLERAIKRLGPCNRGALSEDKSLRDRIAFYEEQSKDVLTGIEELKSLIDETDSHAGALFKDALEKIDVRFNGLFQRLFGGGEAHLQLQEGVDLWEAGVEIVARPPGKVFAYLTQLSGGEQTLTALSLLFASMEVARVPLVVLDEVDAALDEVNLRRFADLVVDYSNSVQIIAMTHRRQTMERATIMYGVTMSEPGLSQVIGVKLEDWD